LKEQAPIERKLQAFYILSTTMEKLWIPHKRF
jgi:hypothetical protein